LLDFVLALLDHFPVLMQHDAVIGGDTDLGLPKLGRLSVALDRAWKGLFNLRGEPPESNVCS
jgi:hypothetical protein